MRQLDWEEIGRDKGKTEEACSNKINIVRFRPKSTQIYLGFHTNNFQPKHIYIVKKTQVL